MSKPVMLRLVAKTERGKNVEFEVSALFRDLAGFYVFKHRYPNDIEVYRINPATIQPAKDPRKRDWTEDLSDENGNYQNKCAVCGEHFIGHKMRRICRVCSDPCKALLDEIQNHFANLKTEMTYSVRSSDGKERVEGFGLPGPAVKDAALAILEKVRASL